MIPVSWSAASAWRSLNALLKCSRRPTNHLSMNRLCCRAATEKRPESRPNLMDYALSLLGFGCVQKIHLPIRSSRGWRQRRQTWTNHGLQRRPRVDVFEVVSRPRGPAEPYRSSNFCIGNRIEKLLYSIRCTCHNHGCVCSWVFPAHGSETFAIRHYRNGESGRGD